MAILGRDQRSELISYTFSQRRANASQRSLEEIDEIFEGKKPDHVHLGTDTTLGRIEKDQEKGGKDFEDNVTVMESKDLR